MWGRVVGRSAVQCRAVQGRLALTDHLELGGAAGGGEPGRPRRHLGSGAAVSGVSGYLAAEVAAGVAGHAVQHDVGGSGVVQHIQSRHDEHLRGGLQASAVRGGQYGGGGQLGRDVAVELHVVPVPAHHSQCSADHMGAASPLETVQSLPLLQLEVAPQVHLEHTVETVDKSGSGSTLSPFCTTVGRAQSRSSLTAAVRGGADSTSSSHHNHHSHHANISQLQ